jgi:hypothetical protein
VLGFRVLRIATPTAAHDTEWSELATAAE